MAEVKVSFLIGQLNLGPVKGEAVYRQSSSHWPSRTWGQRGGTRQGYTSSHWV